MHVGSPYIQQDKGLGSFLAGLFRIVKPVLVSSAKSLGKAALISGTNIVSDIAGKQEGSKVKDIVSNRVTETVKSLTNKLQQTGKGLKRKRKPTKTAKFNDVFA
jgi:hypothetical protein